MLKADLDQKIKDLEEQSKEQAGKINDLLKAQAEKDNHIVELTRQADEFMAKVKDMEARLKKNEIDPRAINQAAKQNLTKIDLWNVKKRIAESGQSPLNQQRILKSIR